MEINKHNQDANKLSQLLFDETFKKSNNPQKPYTTYTGDSTETFTPRETAEKMVEMLDDLDKKSREVNGQIDEQKPGAIWNDKTTFLDPSCKTGVFLKVIFDKLDTALQNEEVYGDSYKDVTTRRNHILDNQLFGLTLDNEQSLIASRRNVSGRWDYKNIQYIDKYIQKVVNKDERKKLKDMIKESLGVNMFDVVIGNPPYQHSNGGGQRAKPIYQTFVNLGFSIGSTVSMITPARWFSAEDNESTKMRSSIICKHTSKIYYVDRQSDIFKGTNIRGGITYFATSINYDGQAQIFVNDKLDSTEYLECNDDVFIVYKDSRAIINKVKALKEKNFDLTNFSGSPFGLETDFRGGIYGRNVSVLTSDGVVEAGELDIAKARHLYKYNVITGNMITSTVINLPEILKPMEACTNTYCVLETYDNLEQAEICRKYFSTRFIRFLIGVTINNQRVSKSNYRYVPCIDNHIISQMSIQDIDAYLYSKYNISKNEIKYIESMVK